MANVEIRRTTKIVREAEEVVEEIKKCGISDSAHKQWMTKLHNIIEECKLKLDNSISYSDHQKWMTRKDTEIEKLKKKIEEQEIKIRELKRSR